MDILCVADTVVESLLDKVRGGPAVDNVHLVLGCGDLPPEYLNSLRHLYNVPLFYILGNHDIRHNDSPPLGCTHRHKKMIRAGEMNIIGFSGSRWYNGGMNQYTEKQMAGFVRSMRLAIWRKGGVDIILTHAPPRFIHDQEDPCHRGFRIFRKMIEKYQPRFFLHGHIHALFSDDGERITSIKQTRVINCYGYYVLKI